MRAAVTQVVGRNALMTPLSAWKEILSPQLTVRPLIRSLHRCSSLFPPHVAFQRACGFQQGQYFEFQQNMQSEYPRDLQVRYRAVLRSGWVTKEVDIGSFRNHHRASSGLRGTPWSTPRSLGRQHTISY